MTHPIADASLAAQAERALQARFAPNTGPSLYGAAFRTVRGRELSLQRERQDAIYLWAECFDSAAFPSIEVRNRSNPGQPYGEDQPRPSNLNAKRAPRLMRGNVAYYLRISSLADLNAFFDWYEKQ
jgi:hypothetical protein